MNFLARRAARAALPENAKSNPRGPAGVHFPKPPLTILELRNANSNLSANGFLGQVVADRAVPRTAAPARAKAKAQPVGAFFVIENEKGERLPCLWKAEIRFHDPESAEAFLELYHRLGHDYPEFSVCGCTP